MIMIDFGNEVALPFPNVQAAAQEVLEYLHAHLGFQLWMLTRVENDDWVVLLACDHGYGVKTGDVFRWSDSFCAQMVRGLGPNIAPCSTVVAAYAQAPINSHLAISAYIGIPIYLPDNTLFGTLCAIDPQIQPDTITEQLAFVKLQARLLSTILHHDLKAQENARLYERADVEAQMDGLTGIYNRRGWDRLFEREEEHCHAYGLAAAVIMVDLDDLKTTNDLKGHAAGDQLLRETANLLQANVRSCDVVARLGGDEFGILAIETNPETTRMIVDRIQQSFEVAGIAASIGWAVRVHGCSLQKTLELADQQMYQQKAHHKRDRAAHLEKS